MATKRKTKAKPKKSLWRRNLRTIIAMVVAFFAGMIVFNIDRPTHMSEQRNVLKQYLPSWMKRFLPENTAQENLLPAGAEVSVRVIEVYDGDTVLVVSLDNKDKYRLRLYGIDAPESAQAGGDEARLALHRLIYGKQIDIQVMDNDIYSRSVAKIYYNNTYINLAMVNDGWAWHYAQYAPRDVDLPLAQNSARQRQLGIWKNANPQPPWEYRKALRD